MKAQTGNTECVPKQCALASTSLCIPDLESSIHGTIDNHIIFPLKALNAVCVTNQVAKAFSCRYGPHLEGAVITARHNSLGRELEASDGTV